MSQSSRFFKASGHPIHAIVAGHEEEILAQHGIYPPRSGHMLCPLHNDRRPSFRWDFDCKRFYCSRCGSGTVVDVVMRLYGVGFSEAIGRIRANNFQPMDPAEMAERKARQARGEENRYRLQLNKARWRWAMCGRLQAVKGFSHGAASVGAAMCSAYSCGSHKAAGHNAFRGSGPGQ